MKAKIKNMDFTDQFHIAKLIEKYMREAGKDEDEHPLYNYVNGWSDQRIANQSGVEGVTKADVATIRLSAGFVMPKGRPPSAGNEPDFGYINSRIDALVEEWRDKAEATEEMLAKDSERISSLDQTMRVDRRLMESKLKAIEQRLEALEGAVLGPSTMEKPTDPFASTDGQAEN